MPAPATSSRCRAASSCCTRTGTTSGARPGAMVAEADVAMVTSFCPDGIEATGLVLDAPRAVRVFYDLDTPVTLSRLDRGESLSYVGPRGLHDFDLVLSYTGGAALDRLRAETRRAPGRAALRACRPGDPPADGGTARFRCRPFLSRHLCGRPSGGARGAVRRAGAAATRSTLPHRRRPVSGRTFLGRRTSSSSATCRRTTTRPSSRPAA